MTEEKARNLAIVLRERKQFSYEEIPMPHPKPGSVIIRVHTTGICGSDVHYWAHGKCGPFVCNGPIILGHESSGIVEDVGQGVQHLKRGDRVAMEPGVPCRLCTYCRNGKYNLCPEMKFFATPPIDGTLANFIEHPADFCYKMPDHMSFEEGALLEPLSVAVHSCQRGRVTAGSHVFILLPSARVTALLYRTRFVKHNLVTPNPDLHRSIPVLLFISLTTEGFNHWCRSYRPRILNRGTSVGCYEGCSYGYVAKQIRNCIEIRYNAEWWS
eukprot:TRINITY_DN757_c0_g2_i2.p1 TRINITY_DN757_c0_g2~~TRINITY_DN757_c0_g2_i2.p1  ORF type:complete len:270 (-),score=8.37 TRINITY_DN757_c0_g2_i2:757-1566(-)